ncbi:MAG TPA: acyl-CoA dehydrogenase [Mycobacteriales bacterium]|jgi:alkylation response protein AidB-like acyl-CoA dehydrogenase
MDFRDTPDEAEFRRGLRTWLAENLPADWSEREPHVGRYDLDFARDWARRLDDAGYVGLTWPREYGGGGAPYTHQAIFLEETARAGAPDHLGVIGLGMAGPTIIAHGTDAQKKQHLARILSGETVFCQGFSEPSSGSDLASVRTRAVRDGDEFVVNGQKVWSSYAHIADYCLLLARTDRQAPNHRALTYFLLDMRSPGVTVRPLTQLTGDPEFNEIFLTDVRVPASAVVGEVGGGWQVAMTTLLHERGTLGFALTARLEVLFGHLLQTVRRTGRAGDPLVRDRVARLFVDLQGLRYTNYRALTTLVRTGVPGPEGSVAKLHWSETNQRLTTLALELLGPDSQLDSGGAFWSGYWQYQQLRSRGNTIEAGTSEILRSIVAERVLGLPRSR